MSLSRDGPPQDSKPSKQSEPVGDLSLCSLRLSWCSLRSVCQGPVIAVSEVVRGPERAGASLCGSRFVQHSRIIIRTANVTIRFVTIMTYYDSWTPNTSLVQIPGYRIIVRSSIL